MAETSQQPLENQSLETWITEGHKGSVRYSYKVRDVLHQSHSKFQKIDVVDTEFYGRMLLLDGCVMTTEWDEFIYHEMISHIPLLAHPKPEQVLIIGGGDGGTIREVLKHPSIQGVVLCEIDGDVIDICKQYLPTIACKLEDSRVTLAARDGIEYIKEKKCRFDVILIDSTDPIGPGEGLFTETFYTDVRQALKPGGIMTNQTESPIGTPREMTCIYRLLRRVFPVVVPYLATVPTYPGHYWSWAFCSEGRRPLGTLNDCFAAELEKTTRYYNRQVHEAAFALPNFVRNQIGEKVKRSPSGKLEPC